MTECFCNLEDFSEFISNFNFTKLFIAIQINKTEFEYDKKNGKNFRIAYSKFFSIMMNSFNKENFWELIQIFGNESKFNIKIKLI